jgi:regulator of sigma E protease
MDAIINILLLLVILVALVLLHELGHFITAKRAGVKVHEFGIGFPPRALTLFRRGETAYTLNWLPIGGFVRLEAEEGESVDPRAFVNQKLPTRLWILVAGVLINFVLAWIIFSLIAFTAQPTWSVRVANVQPDSPAAAAGLIGGEFLATETIELQDASGQPTGETVEVDRYDESGDLIVAVDGQRFPVFADMARADADGFSPAVLDYMRERPATELVLTVERADGTVVELEATTRSAEDIAAGMGALGFQIGAFDFGSQSNGLVESIAIGFERTLEASTLILRGLGAFVVSIFDSPAEGEAPQIAGPLGIVSVIGDIRAEAPPIFLLFFVGLLSANLAIINALPFPPMDGGRIAMALVQAASRGAVSPAAERLVYLTGFVLLMTLLVIVTIGDISRLTS